MISLDHITSLFAWKSNELLEILKTNYASFSEFCVTGSKSLELSEWGTIFAPVIVYWVYSTIFFVVSYFKWSPVEVHRLPTNQKGRFQNRMTVGHVLRTVFMQHIVQAIVAFVVAVAIRERDGPGPVNYYVAAIQFVVACFVIDTYQYWMHRMMHTYRPLYRMFHSVHHQLTVPYAYGALYNHPIEGFLMDTLSGAISSTITLMHPWTATIFYTFATMKTVDDHCGFDLWWDPLQRFFPNNAEYHDRHHWGKGIRYNYSQPFFTFWDSWCGTQWKDEVPDKSETDTREPVDEVSATRKDATIRKRLPKSIESADKAVAPVAQKHPQASKKFTESQKIATPVLWDLGSNISKLPKTQILATKLAVCKK